MCKRPAYFDSQAAAAAALGIDINELRDAKRRGCPAFRSGRVYRDVLLSWWEAEQLRKTGWAASGGVGSKNARAVVAQTIGGISECGELGILTADQCFDFCHTIVEAAGDPEIRELFREMIFNWLQRDFSEIAFAKARKAHPRIMSWFDLETIQWGLRDCASDNIEEAGNGRFA